MVARRIRLVTAVLVACVLTGVCVLKACEAELGWGDCFYVMLSSTTTTGWGDVSPRTAGGRAFMSVYHILPVVVFFYLLHLLFAVAGA